MKIIANCAAPFCVYNKAVKILQYKISGEPNNIMNEYFLKVTQLFYFPSKSFL